MIDDLNKGLLRRTFLKGAAASLAAAALTPSNAFAGESLGAALEKRRIEKLRVKNEQDKIAYSIIGAVIKSPPFDNTYANLGTHGQAVFLREFQKWVLGSRVQYDNLLQALSAPSVEGWDSLMVGMMKSRDLGTNDAEREAISAMLQEIIDRASNELKKYNRGSS